jgi:DUF1680 family protein
MFLEPSRRRFLQAAVAASSAQLLPAQSSNPSAPQAAVNNLTHSPHAVLRSIPIGAVKVRDGFWARRMEVNRDSAIAFTYDQMAQHGRFDNFLRWDGAKRALRAGFHTTHPSGLRAGGDSETYKWIEAASFALDSKDSPELRKNLDEVVRGVIGAQEPSGYLNTYFVEDHAAQRMLPATQVSGHELYNGGHLLLAGIAYYRTTGNRGLLDAGIRYVNDFLLPNYGPDPTQTPLLSGHPGAEMAFVELYRQTGDPRHLQLAGYILQGDPRIPLEQSGSVAASRTLAFTSTYLFCGIPFVSRTRISGHAVRALYACCGATDYYLETGDPAYKKTLETLWNDMVNGKMYITGAVGIPRGESFGELYELPNVSAYAESCASIGNFMWNWRLLCATGEARFADLMERVLYNGVNAGTSLDGKLYNYCNPLALDAAGSERIRKPWYSTNCCPPNLERLFASIPGYLYSTAKEGIYVHLFETSELNWSLEDGVGLKLVQNTRYPWQGDVELSLTPTRASEFTLFVRVPAWSRNTKAELDGAALDDPTPGQYLAIRRRWDGTHLLRIRLDMTPRLTAANGKVESDSRRVAVERGPLVYCMEQIDQEASGPLPGYSLVLGAHGADIRQESDSALGGIVRLRAQGMFSSADVPASSNPYLPFATDPAKPVSINLIPYYAFANRARSAMQVWIPYVRSG